MAAVPLTGALGEITLPAAGDGSTQATQIYKWDATIAGDLFDASQFQTGGGGTYHKESARGLYDLKGSCEGFAEHDAVVALTQIKVGQSQGTAGFVLATVNGENYTFTGIISNIRLDVPKSGLVRFTCTFESSGAVVRNT